LVGKRKNFASLIAKILRKQRINQTRNLTVVKTMKRYIIFLLLAKFEKFPHIAENKIS